MGSQQLFAGLLLAGAIVFIYLGMTDKLPGVWAAAFGSAGAAPKPSNPGALSGGPTSTGLPGGAKYVASIGKSGVMLSEAT